MNLLPKASGNRPRLACEIAAQGVVAARSPEPGGPLAAVARVVLASGAVVPSLKPGNIADRVAVIAALRRALEGVGTRSNARRSEMTLIIPDGAVRVLLLDFDALPAKLSEALPLVRFRLKKLVPFDADDAMVSFQVMSTSRAAVRVLAVAIPRDVLSEYESAAREAGFEPGAVLPSTLAALAGLSEGEGASLVVNAHSTGVTTAIVRAGILLLHRTVELAEAAAAVPANLPAALFEPSVAVPNGVSAPLALVDREESAGEWAAQQPLPEFGRDPYADRLSTEAAVQDEDGISGLPVSPSVNGESEVSRGQAVAAARTRYVADMYASEEPAPRFPYAAPTVTADLSSELHNSTLYAPASPDALQDAGRDLGRLAAFAAADEPELPVHTLSPDAQSEEIARAVSVAVAYFEDSLGAAPGALLSAGPIGAEQLLRTLREQGIAQEDGLRVRELVEASALAPDAVSAAVSRGSLAGVVGALSS